MEEQLKIKSSPLVIGLRVIAIFITILSIAFLFLGLVDIRTEEQRAEDERKELISTMSFSHAKEAVKYARKNLGIIVIKEVRYLKSPKHYVLVIYTDFQNVENEITYSGKDKRGYVGGQIYHQALASIASSNLYFGNSTNSSNYTTVYKDKELQILLEEAL